ncbi:MAG TPA: glycosyltransferase family 4 protein [Rhodopila sp.]|uniref:glycosyltransferase family 4 protein n=1 Tax=Rhodopila sp. TaxID=2480087 RepID=UPI002D001A4C|nr:glycosyltransferase family 4 protein [Rhodopila sp.]HVY16296.1 glycosyltransferase family 4 protein [Rhodopila sp.]
MPDPAESPVILQVLPSLVTGGVERGTVEITQAIAEAEGVALVASAGGPMVRLVERAGGTHLTLPLASKTPWRIWRNAGLLEQIIREHRVSLVHARSRAPAWSAWLASQRTGVPFVTTYHGTYSEDLPFKRAYNAVMARGQIVIAASRFIADLVMRQHGVPEQRIRVIPRGVDPALFDPAAVSGSRIARLAEAWSLPHDAHVVMLPGRLTAWKGHGVLLDAVARLGRRNVMAVLVGSHQGRHRYAEALQRQAATLGIAEQLRLVGQCDDMPAALMLADVVVHASTQPEAFGRVVIEAQAMARPVIAADLGGPVETVRHGETGWRVPPGDAEALAGMLAHALDLDPEVRAALGARARASVPTVRAMQEATLDVYEAVLTPGEAVLTPEQP